MTPWLPWALLAALALTGGPAGSQNRSPGVDACVDNRFHSAVQYWNDARSTGARLEPQEARFHGIAYARLAMLAEETYPFACRLTADLASLYLEAPGSGEAAFLKGMALAGLAEWQGAEEAFTLAAKAPGSRKAGAAFWRQVVARKVAGKPVEWDRLEGQAADRVMARFLIEGILEPVTTQAEGWWKDYLQVLTAVNSGDAGRAETLLAETLFPPRVLRLAGRETAVEFYDPTALVLAQLVWAERARQELEAALKESAQGKDTRYCLVRVLCMLDEDSLAQAHLEAIKDVNYRQRGEAHLAASWKRTGQDSRAQAAWVKLLDSKDYYARADAACFLFLAGARRDKAKRTLRTACDRSKAEQQVYLSLAKMYQAEGAQDSVRYYLSRGYNRNSTEVSRWNLPEYQVAFAQSCYLGGRLGYPEATQTLYFLQNEFPFMRGLHDAIQRLFSASLPTVNGDTKE